MTEHQSRPAGAESPAFITIPSLPQLFERTARSLRHLTEAQTALIQTVMQSQFAVMEAILQGMSTPSLVHVTQYPQGDGQQHEIRRDNHRP